MREGFVLARFIILLSEYGNCKLLLETGPGNILTQPFECGESFGSSRSSVSNIKVDYSVSDDFKYYLFPI